MAKINVIHMLGSLNSGGTENLILDIFRQGDDEINLLCVHRKRGTLHAAFKQTNITMLELPYNKKNIVSFIINLRRVIVKNKIYLIHCHQPVDAFAAILACFSTKVKVILSVHNLGTQNGKLDQLLKYATIKYVSAVIYVSKFSKRFILNKYGLADSKRYFILPNSIHLSKFNIQYTTSIRNALGISKRMLLIGTVGSFRQERDHLTICKFLSLLHSKNIDFNFLFIGDHSNPELYDRCISYCRENHIEHLVHFLGVRQDVPQILPQLDAFVYSSIYDTFGIAVIEAMYAGIPVFANDWEVMLEITNRGKYVTIWRSKDEEDLTSKFTQFLRHPEPYQDKAKKASEYVEEKYNIKNHIEGLKTIYKSLL